MKAVTYKRLMDSKRHFVGFQRTITEYLPAGTNKWQLEVIEHNDELSCKTSIPPRNIVNMKRPSME